MAAGPIGSTWQPGSWSDTCWEQGSWADAVARHHGQPFWQQFRQIRPRARDVDALVLLGVEGRFATGTLDAEAAAVQKRSVFAEALASVGTMRVEAERQQDADIRCRQSVWAEVTSEIGQMEIRAQKQPTAAHLDALIAVLFNDAV